MLSAQCFEMMKQRFKNETVAMWLVGYQEPLLYALFETKEARASTVFLLNGCFDIPFLIQICREGAD